MAAALALDQGHEVTGVTLKLWNGKVASGCCSVADVDDARSVSRRLGIVHHVFDDTGAFEDHVVGPYVSQHSLGLTPNPCIECNRHLKFGRLLERALRLGFDALATGHHARVERREGQLRLLRGDDRAKDQSYVLSVLDRGLLPRVLFPVGDLTKTEVREHARRLGLRTAAKPDSQDVCFVAPGRARRAFLAERIELHEGELVDACSGEVVGRVDAVELVTAGQRRGLGAGDHGARRYALAVDVRKRRVLVGDLTSARSCSVRLGDFTWALDPPQLPLRVLAQTSAHGEAVRGLLVPGHLHYDQPERLVAPGQTVAFYHCDDPDLVLGSAPAVQ